MLTPYYTDELVTLYHGDCLEILPQLQEQSIGLVLTDPPYCSGANESSRRAKRSSITPESVRERPTIDSDAMGTLGFEWVTRRWLLSARKVVRRGGHLACFIDWRMMPPLATLIESAGWMWNNIIVWDKGYIGLGRGFRPQHELILTASSDAPEWFSNNSSNVIKSTRLTRTEHPHQKPVDLLVQIIKTCTGDGEALLDPFCGAGSTVVAAKQLGRKITAIDIDEKYCEISARRSSQEMPLAANGI